MYERSHVSVNNKYKLKSQHFISCLYFTCFNVLSQIRVSGNHPQAHGLYVTAILARTLLLGHKL